MAFSSGLRDPYIIGPPIDNPQSFFGRESFFSSFEDNLKQQSTKVVLLHGQRRIGKSSVLRQINNFVAPDEFVFVYFDLQNKNRLKLGEVLHQIAAEILKKIPVNSDRIQVPLTIELEADPSSFDSIFLPRIYKILGNKKLVLLLDEFDALNNNHNPDSAVKHFFPYLQSIINQQKQLLIVPAIGRQPEELENFLNLFKDAPTQEIGLLDEFSATQLITRPATETLKYESEAIKAILALSAGHPLITQGICSALFRRSREINKWSVSREDVENNEIVNKAIEITGAGLAWFWDGLLPAEKVIFSAAAWAQEIAVRNGELHGGEPLSLLKKYGAVQTEPLVQAREKLIKWGFLSEVQNSGLDLSGLNFTKCKVKIELVRRWLVDQHSLRREIRELENLDSEAKRIYEHANQLYHNRELRNALQQYEQVLKANPNHFKALFEMAEVCLEIEEFDKAVELYTRAYQIDPERNQDEFVESLLNYGQKLIREGKPQLADEHFVKVLEIDPNNLQAQNYREEIRLSTHKIVRSPNPFMVGKPVTPEHFVGRESEIAAAFDQIYNRSHLAIWGGPGMGKTSFLQKLESPQAWQDQGMDSSQAVIVRFSCESITPFTPSDFWTEIISLVKDKLADQSALSAEIDIILQTGKPTKDSLRQILRKLKLQDKFLVLLIDDFDVALYTNQEYDEDAMQRFLSECRNLAVHSAEGQNLSMIVTSLKRLNELGPKLNPNASPWYNHYLFLRLKTFNNSEIDDIYKVLRIPELREATKKITGGHPSLLQIFGFLMYRDLLTANAPSVDKFVSDFESVAQQIFENIWQRCSEIEQTLLMLMALSGLKSRLHQKGQFDISGIEFIFSQREAELIKLEEQGVVIHTVHEEKNLYSFTSSIMQHWVIQQLRKTDENWLQARKKVFINLMSRQQLEKFTTAIKWLWNNQNQVPPILEWFGNLKTAFPQGIIS